MKKLPVFCIFYFISAAWAGTSYTTIEQARMHCPPENHLSVNPSDYLGFVIISGEKNGVSFTSSFEPLPKHMMGTTIWDAKFFNKNGRYGFEDNAIHCFYSYMGQSALVQIDLISGR